MIASGCDSGVNFAPFLNQKSTKIASWTRLGASFGRLEPSWRRLEASWSRLGASWGRLGASWKRLKASWSVLGTLQEAPEREILIFQWFWQVWGGESTDGRARAMAARFGPDP